MWEFPEIRQYAIKRIEEQEVNSAATVRIAKRCNVDSWLFPAYVALCERTESLSLQEGMDLGLHDVVIITKLREQLRPIATPNSSYMYPARSSLSSLSPLPARRTTTITDLVRSSGLCGHVKPPPVMYEPKLSDDCVAAAPEPVEECVAAAPEAVEATREYYHYRSTSTPSKKKKWGFP